MNEQKQYSVNTHFLGVPSKTDIKTVSHAVIKVGDSEIQVSSYNMHGTLDQVLKNSVLNAVSVLTVLSLPERYTSEEHAVRMSELIEKIPQLLKE
jgi:hypothetical protein